MVRGVWPRALATVTVASLLALGCSLLVDTDEIGKGCRADEKACNGACVSNTDPRYGCASQTCQPCALPNATSACSPEGRCFVASCLESFDDCNKKDSDGCEVNTDVDPQHCGGCDAPECKVDGAYPACASGQCAIRKCKPGFKDCNRESDDGCERLVYDDPDNCGNCGVECDGGLACVEGYCSAAETGD